MYSKKTEDAGKQKRQTMRTSAPNTMRVNRASSKAHSRADWRRVEQLYRQFSSIASDPEKQNILPDVVMGSLAESLSRTFAHYDRKEQQFMEDVFNIWSDVERVIGSATERFRWLYYDKRLERFPAYNPPGEERRRPKPFEATVETCRRLTDLNRVRDALMEIPGGGILGGSVSYGRFFNVCGAISGKSSDTDLLLVLPDYDDLPKVAEALNQVNGIDRNSLATLKRRVRLFAGIRPRRKRCILSHKLKFWEDIPDPYLKRQQISGQYQLSLHVFSWNDFEFMIVRDKPILELESDGPFVREILDYRDTCPIRFDNQRSFSGIDYSVPLEADAVEGGFLSRVRVCHILKDRFYPGLHQNLILPQFEIRWETPSIRLYLPVIGFRWKVLERLREERRLRPFEIQSLSLSHTRSAVFAPHITRRADRE